MKKYLQIAAVLGFFGILVLIRQFRGGDAQPVVGIPNANTNSSSNNQTNTQPTSAASSGSSTPTTGSASSQQTGSSSGKYKDGTYTGPVTDAFYGNVQVQVTISSGKLTNVQFLQYPNDNGTSREVNSQAIPLLQQEALQAQSSQVDGVSGASQTSNAFQQSLSGALQQAS